MLRKFKVSNFKCFDSNFELDLTKVNAYEFNKNCIKENIVKTGLIYGYNGCGKSNLALALFDIIEHLTDKNRNPSSYKNYLCANSSEKHASFYYEFYFNSKIVVYEYKKTDYQTILYERLSIDGEDFVIFDRKNSETAIVKFDGTETLNTTITNNELSVLKYIKSNAQLNNNEINDTFHKLMQFIDSMLFFRSLEDRTYLGFCTGSKNITDEIIEKNKVQDFEQFLNDAHVECKLEVIHGTDGKRLAFKIGDKLLDFIETISTGTSSLTLFYHWYLHVTNHKISFLFIDEFDAFYHHELSKLIIRKMIDSDVQTIFTSHNISNLTNDLLRPDCYFLMNKKATKSLSNCTEKELRLAHNIEKMYKAGTFNVE